MRSCGFDTRTPYPRPPSLSAAPRPRSSPTGAFSFLRNFYAAPQRYFIAPGARSRIIARTDQNLNIVKFNPYGHSVNVRKSASAAAGVQNMNARRNFQYSAREWETDHFTSPLSSAATTVAVSFFDLSARICRAMRLTILEGRRYALTGVALEGFISQSRAEICRASFDRSSVPPACASLRGDTGAANTG